MSSEIPLQADMFTDELVDARTPGQKLRDHKSELPQSVFMFRQRDIAQFGVTAHPLLPISPTTRLTLATEDPRTRDEIESDTQREAEKRTISIFADFLDDYEKELFELAQMMDLPFTVL